MTTADWSREAAIEPYRVAYSVRSKTWTVVDIRVDDEAQVEGPFASREEAVSRAGVLNHAPKCLDCGHP